jgi:hypothetical protein
MVRIRSASLEGMTIEYRVCGHGGQLCRLSPTRGLQGFLLAHAEAANHSARDPPDVAEVPFERNTTERPLASQADDRDDFVARLEQLFELCALRVETITPWSSIDTAGSASSRIVSESPRWKASYIARTTSRFSRDIGYSRRPTASWASVSSR